MAFCGRCGTRLASLCPSCGFPNPEGFAFCGKCGARVAEASTPPRQSPPAYTSPRSYPPKHLAEKILTSKAALEGERKQVTVLFADLKGSMELLVDRDPEEARKFLDPVLERMMEAVHRYEGTVNQVMGDGIMALFGAPVAHEDHAVRACYAALQMQESVARYAETLRRTEAVGAHIRVGLNSGEVVVRSVGSDLRMDYSAVGQTTHLAARMEQMAAPGSTFITAGTLRLAEGYVEVRALGPVPIKGLPDPVDIYELTGAAAARTRFQVAAIRGLSRFVGREAEIDQLRRALRQVSQGQGQIVAIIGEAGVGKSRLVHELSKYETSLYPEVEYTFKHALTHEVAYASLLLERRRALHARILAAMELRHADRLAEHVERLAHHAVRAEAWDPAVGYLRQAGLKAAGRSAYRQAAAAFEEALVAVGHLPETPITLEAAVDLRTDLRDVLTPLDELARALDHLLVAAPQAERLGDLARMGWVSTGLMNTLALMAQYRRAFAEGVRTLDLADRLQDAGLRATTFYRLGAIHYILGDFGPARECLREAVALAAADRPLHLRRNTTSLPRVLAPLWLAWTESETGSFPEALELAEEAVRVARAANRPFSLAAALGALGHVRLRRGDLDQAASALEEGLEVSRAWNIINQYQVDATLGHVRTLTGRHPEALALLEDAVRQGSARGPRALQALRLAWLGEAHLHAGRVDEARSRATEALDFAVTHEERVSQAWTLRLLAKIAMHPTASGAEEAQGYYRQALEVAGQFGMRPLTAHCHLDLTRLYRRIGDQAKAQEHLTRAATMYREMGMTFWLEKAEAEIGSAP
jgi:class 3 adenylate cyclase/tetratricopeptide (TPR) repeat protein